MGIIRKLWPKKRRPVMGYSISFEIDKCQPCTNCGAIIMGKKYTVSVQIGNQPKTIGDLCQVCQKLLNDETGDKSTR